MNKLEADRHVLFITGEYPPLTGGVGAYTERLAGEVVDLGWQASVLTSAQIREHNFDSSIDVYPLIKRWDWRIWRSVPDLADRIQATWLHVQYQTAAFGMNPAINFALGRWRKRGQYVAWTYHDLLAPYLFPKAGARLRNFVTRRPAYDADLTVVTNEGDRLALDVLSGNVVRIPIGSNIRASAVTAEERTAIRRRYGYSADDLVIAYFGFLNRSKGGLSLIRTLERVRRKLTNAHLLMIGERVGASDPTNYEYLQEVEALVDEIGMRSFVQWTGRLEDEQVSHALSAADVLCMPYEDGASLRRGTLMAALAHGCAVVTTRPHVPTPELVDGRDLLYVPAKDPAASAAAIVSLAGDKQLATRLRAGARAASRQFTWQQIARQHADLYESLTR